MQREENVPVIFDKGWRNPESMNCLNGKPAEIEVLEGQTKKS